MWETIKRRVRLLLGPTDQRTRAESPARSAGARDTGPASPAGTIGSAGIVGTPGPAGTEKRAEEPPSDASP
jgi:hypothetical protein